MHLFTVQVKFTCMYYLMLPLGWTVRGSNPGWGEIFGTCSELFDVAFGLDGPGIESRLGRDFRHLFRPALRPLSLLYNGYQGFLWGKVRPGRDADTSTPSSAEVKNRVLSLRVFVVYERVKPTYLLFDVVSVDVYCVSSCSNVIRLDVFRIIRFEIKVKNV